jgi:hypothetical protein
MSTYSPNKIVFHYDGPDGFAASSSTAVTLSLGGSGAARQDSYEDIDRWLRQRLGFGSADRLQFLNKKGEGEEN